MPYTVTKQWVDAIVDAMADVVKEDELSLQKFGKFYHKKRAARYGRHPVTGAPVHVPAHVIVEFEPCASIENAVYNLPVVSKRDKKVEPDYELPVNTEE